MELKPCPFCGGKARIGHSPNCNDFWIICRECATYYPKDMSRKYTESEAIEAWNTRWERKCNLIPAPYREFTIGYEYKCSMCGCLMTDHDSYCSECGARRVSRC